MEVERKRSIALSIIFGLVLLASIIFFFWGSVINRGTINVHGEAPFSIRVFEEQTFQCDSSPCEIRTSAGDKVFIIEKDGYQALVKDVRVKLWGESAIFAELFINPYIENSAEIPSEEAPTLIIKNQALFEANSQVPLVKFPNKLTNPRIYNSDKFALILSDQAGYKVDLKARSRETVRKIIIDDGKWSPSGKFFIFSSPNSSNLWLFDGDTATKLSLNISTRQVSWVADDQLVFVTDQDAITQNSQLDFQEQVGNNFTFAFYDTLSSSYEKLYTSTELDSLPSSFVALANLQAVYYQVGDQNYKLVLK